MWIIRLGKRIQGPYTEEKLRTMVARNEFSSLYQVHCGDGEWVSARDLVNRLTAGSEIAEKWESEAKRRQAMRAAAEATKFAHTARADASQQRQGPTEQTRPGNFRQQSDIGGDPSSASGISVEVSGCGKSVVAHDGRGAKTILHPTSFVMRQNELTAIIGPSGCGKSTLLSLLTGRERPSVGSISVFGCDLNSDLETVRRLINVVRQENVFLKELTVRASLKFTAALRLPATTSPDEINERVSAAIGMVHLNGLEETRIKKISGGQQRRLSLAQELLSNPDVLYLDEVTSGLDVKADAETMELLHDIALTGRSIAIITHNLDNLQGNCEKLLVLAAGGYVVFHGSPADACRHFKVGRVSDLLPIVQSMSKVDAAENAERIRQKFYSTEKDRTLAQEVRIPQHRQRDRQLHDFRVLLSRQTAQLFASPTESLFALLICAVVGVSVMLVSTDIKESGISPVMTLLLTCYFVGLLHGGQEIVRDRLLFWREAGTGMPISAYLASKVFVQGTIVSFQATVLMALVMNAIDSRIETINLCMIAALVGITGLSTGLLVSALSPNSAAANTVQLLPMIAQYLFSGIDGPLTKEFPKFCARSFSIIHYALHKTLAWLKVAQTEGGESRLAPKVEAALTNIDVIDFSLAHVAVVAAMQSAIMLCLTYFMLVRTAKSTDPMRS